MKKFLTLMVAVPFAAMAFASSASAGPIQKAYLDPWGTGLTDYPEGIAKLTRNCDTGEIIVRGHGLAAGRIFELRSGGVLTDQEEVAVGNGTAGLGNNVLIKETKPVDNGSYWNLFDVTDGAVRILRGPKEAC